MIIRGAAQSVRHQSEHDTERQVPHGKHMLSLITAASAGEGEEALCLFCSEPWRAGDSAMAALHEKQFIRAGKANKRRRMTSNCVQDRRGDFYLLTSKRLERPRTVEFSLPDL